MSTTYQVCIFGNGARETALKRALLKNKPQSFHLRVDITEDTKKLQLKPNLVIVGSEKYLVEVTNTCKKLEIPCFGVSEKNSQLETSKLYGRQFLESLNPNKNPFFAYFDKQRNLFESNTLKNYDYKKYVVKIDGLCSGKGVKTNFEDQRDFIEYCLELNNQQVSFLVEEKLQGEEFSLMTITDGERFIHVPPIQDYKELYKGGPMTGGMGCRFIDVPSEILKEAQKLNEDVIKEVQKLNDEEFIGVLYTGYMICDKTQELKVIEFNCRFGDPESILLFNSFDVNFLELFQNVTEKKCPQDLFCKIDYNWLCKVVVPREYPYIHSQKKVKFSLENISEEYLFPYDKNYIPKVLGESSYSEGKSKVLGESSYSEEKSKVLGESSFETSGGRAFAVIGMTEDEIDETIEEIISYKPSDFFYRKNLFKEKSKYSNIINVNEEVIKLLSENHKIDTRSFANRQGTEVYTVDGVGTKILLYKKLFKEYDAFFKAGEDIMSHCINDLLCAGGHPEKFFDYFGSDFIKPENVSCFVHGCNKAGEPYGVKVYGGETAVMPDVYRQGTSDLVGFLKGSFKYNWIGVDRGDYGIVLPSIGPHTNGYTLIRKIRDKKLQEECLTGHKCYLNEVIKMSEKRKIKAVVHVTGGGIPENVKRVIPKGLKFNMFDFEFPELFKKIQSYFDMSKEEMMRTFNCGVGMIVFVDSLKPEDNVLGCVI